MIHILLVEDNPADARLVELALAEVDEPDFEVVHVERLGQALQRLGSHAFQAVLLDLSLPDSQGLETVSQIKAAEPGVPIVVLSGLLDEDLALQAVKSGAQDYLVKGQGDSYLVARAVRYAVERKRAEDELRHALDELEQRVQERTVHLGEANRRLQQEVGQRQLADQVLRKERDFSTAVLNTVGALVVVLDPQGRIVRFNRECERVTGYSADEVLGRRVWELFIPSSEITDVRRVFEELSIDHAPNTYEGDWTVRDGSRRRIAWSNTVLLDSQGRVEHVIGTGIDVTDWRAAQEHERQRVLQLAHASRLSMMGEMTTELAHELNQPLTAIATYSDACRRMLDRDDWATEDLRDALREISSQALRAGEVIRRLRSFARKETAAQEAVNVNELVMELAAITEVEARWYDVRVELEPGEALPQVYADRVLIEQVILNLIRNAIEAMEASTDTDRAVSVRTRQIEGAVEVAVRDRGAPLAPDDLDRVFDAFYTTKPTGMGMGLAISQSIVQAHGGQLWARPNVDRGATFAFALPLAVPHTCEETA